MRAIVPLVQIQRYGDVRQTDANTVSSIINSLFYRITASLGMSCTGINDTQAQEIAELIRQMHQAVLLLQNESFLTDWLNCLSQVSQIEQVAPFILGTCCKLLYDQHFYSKEQTAAQFSKALSVGTLAEHSAAWLEGFLYEAATILIIDDVIWDIVNQWLSGLENETFNATVPLLRRTFSRFSSSEKIKIAARAKAPKTVLAGAEMLENFNHQRAEQVLPVLRMLMGLNKNA